MLCRYFLRRPSDILFTVSTMARPMAAQNAGSGSRMLMVFVLSAVVVFLVSVVIIMGVVRCQNPILLDLVDICFFF